MVRYRKPRSQGLTLLELLVALVLVGLIVALLSQVFQLSQRVELSLQERGAREQTHQLRLAWLGDAMEAWTPTPLNDPQAFKGTSDAVEGLTALLPWHGANDPRRIRWELRRSKESTSLWVVSEPGGEAMEFLQWPGTSGSWAYLADNGEWRDNWPPPAKLGSLEGLGLPRAIRLTTGLERHQELVWIPKTSAIALTNRRGLEQ